jgi:hypothetical protein
LKLERRDTQIDKILSEVAEEQRQWNKLRDERQVYRELLDEKLEQHKAQKNRSLGKQQQQAATGAADKV